MTAANEKPNCPCCGSDATWQEDECVRHTCTRCRCQWWESQRRAQTAEAMDEAEYTQGLAYDGVVILKDGQPITVDEVLAMLNARSGTVDEAKEREAFEKWCKDNDYATSAPKWAGWLARARGGMDESEAVTLLREVYDHGENFELHERIRVFLGIKD